jgi:hypothetical protein
VKLDLKQPASSRTAVTRRFMEARRQREQDNWRAVHAAVQRRREGAWLAFPSAHQSRATEILRAFDVEARNVGTSPLATFLLHYICCEALGKLLIGSREKIPPHKIFQRGGIEIDLRKLSPTIRRLGIPVSDVALGSVFHTQMETAGQRSCRVLRNAVVHELRSDHVAEVNCRIAELITPMADFIEEVRVRSGFGHLF